MYFFYIYESIGVCINRGWYAEPMGLNRAVSKWWEKKEASCQQATTAKQVCCLGSLFTLLGPIRKLGIGNVAEASGSSKPSFCTHQSRLLQIPLQKGSASSEQRQAPGSLCSGSFPVGLIVKPPRLVLSISSLQSRKLLFLIYWDRVKELQLGKTVLNGAAATNRANYEHAKGKKTWRGEGCLKSWEGMLCYVRSHPPPGKPGGPSLGGGWTEPDKTARGWSMSVRKVWQ